MTKLEETNKIIEIVEKLTTVASELDNIRRSDTPNYAFALEHVDKAIDLLEKW